MTKIATEPTPPSHSGLALGGMDVERLVLVPVLSGLLLLNVVSTASHIEGMGTVTLLGLLSGVYKSLIVAFYVMLIVLLLIRTAAKDNDRNWLAASMAYFGSFAPMVLLGLGGTGDAGPLLSVASVVVMTAGMVFCLYSVSYLGRSFGAVPRARDLVTSGPYAWMRHPLYVGEIVTLLGAILIDLSAYKVSVLVLLIAVQTYRALQEERVLASVFPQYGPYSRRTSRFIPGVV